MSRRSPIRFIPRYDVTTRSGAANIGSSGLIWPEWTFVLELWLVMRAKRLEAIIDKAKQIGVLHEFAQDQDPFPVPFMRVPGSG